MFATLATAVVVVEAPETCASPASFDASLARAGARVRSGPGDDRIELRLAPRATGGAAGTLVITRGGQRSAARALEGASCAEVEDGLALVAALAWDDPPAAVEAAPQAAAAASPASPDAGRSPRRPRPLALGLGASGTTLGAGADRPLATVAALVDLGTRGTGLRPALRVGVAHGATVASRYGATLSLALTTARAEICPAQLALGPFSARPCAVGELGVLRAEVPVSGLASRHRWATAGGALRLGWSGPVGLFVDATPALAGSLSRPTLPDGWVTYPTYRPPAIVPSLTLALGVHFS